LKEYILFSYYNIAGSTAAAADWQGCGRRAAGGLRVDVSASHWLALPLEECGWIGSPRWAPRCEDKKKVGNMYSRCARNLYAQTHEI
jgi:hypothetical protein